jgi:hypothetical protein
MKNQDQFHRMSKDVSHLLERYGSERFYDFNRKGAQRCKEQGNYDLAFEYQCRIWLYVLKNIDFQPASRLPMWKIFVHDFRHAFSDYYFWEDKKRRD